MSKDKPGDNFDSGGGNMNVAKDQGISIQNNYYGNAAPQGGSTPSAPGTLFEEIEHLLAQDKVLDAIERLRGLPEHRREAIGFSRRWHAIQSKQRNGTLTDEQIETEVNKIVEAITDICVAGTVRQAAGSGSQTTTPSSQISSSERDYFENVGGNVYTGPVTIHQQGPELGTAKPPLKTKAALSQALRQEILDFLIPLPVMQSANSRRAALYAAGLDSIIDRVDLNGATYEVVSAILYALEQHGMKEDTPALVLLLRYVATTVGSDKQTMIQNWCEHISKVFITATV